MKNRYQENLKQSAKLYHRNKRNSNFIEGLIQHHLYDATNPSALSWWDDVDFILNDYRVVVAWVHPRQDYQDYIESEAHKNIAHLDNYSGDIFEASTPNYVKVGQSRKKILTYTVNFTEAADEWSKAYQLEIEKTHSLSTYQAQPYIHIEWLAHGLFVDICAPIEVRGVDDLVKLVTLVKRLLKHETTLDCEFPDYVYTKEQWLVEGLNDRKNKLDAPHKVK